MHHHLLIFPLKQGNFQCFLVRQHQFAILTEGYSRMFQVSR
jgi:hypothetical protein